MQNNLREITLFYKYSLNNISIKIKLLPMETLRKTSLLLKIYITNTFKNILYIVNHFKYMDTIFFFLIQSVHFLMQDLQRFKKRADRNFSWVNNNNKKNNTNCIAFKDFLTILI